jgi:hypothetical protein
VFMGRDVAVASRQRSEGFIRGCDGELAFGMTPPATAPTAQPVPGKGNSMHTATKRTLIAAAALTAAGLFGSLPYHGPWQAQGVPIQHHDVALVDADATLLTDEGTLDTALWNDILGSNGAEATLYNDLSTAIGASDATTLLDATGASPIYSGDFNGAESRLFEGLYLDTLASEDSLNQALGISATDSETAILADWTSLPEAPLPTGDTLPDVGATGFDTDLTTIANDEYTLAASDFEGFLSNLASDTSGLSSLGTLLTDFGGSFSDLSNLSTDFSTVITDITALLGGGL